jgi:hypothetical protein
MPMFNVCVRQKAILCYLVAADDPVAAKNKVTLLGHGELLWRDPLDFVDEEFWSAELDQDHEDIDEDPEDDDDGELEAVIQAEMPIVPPPDWARVVRANRLPRAPRVAEPLVEDAEDVDFNG